MKIDTITIANNSEARMVAVIAMELYLRQFTDTDIREAAPTSSIRNAVRFLNQLRNLSSNSDIHHNIDRFPQIGNGKTVTEWVDRNATHEVEL